MPVINAAEVARVIAQSVTQDEGTPSFTMQNWAGVLLSVMRVVEEDYPHFIGADKKAAVIFVVNKLIDDSSISTDEKVALKQVIGFGSDALIDGIVAVSKGLGGLNPQKCSLLQYFRCCSRRVKKS